eukprot:gene23814-9979_t
MLAPRVESKLMQAQKWVISLLLLSLPGESFIDLATKEHMPYPTVSNFKYRIPARSDDPSPDNGSEEDIQILPKQVQ